jgi:hypothetical protein
MDAHKVLLTAAGILGVSFLVLMARKRSESPTEAPDAMSAGWAYNVNQQVRVRDGERDGYLAWVRSL